MSSSARSDRRSLSISSGGYELAARGLMLVVAFVPLFAFAETGRVLGIDRLAAMFFAKPDGPTRSTPT